MRDDAAQRHYDAHRRDQESKRFYNSSAWRRARKQVLVRDHYLCQPCLRRQRITPAEAVHHRDELRQHPDRALDLDNLEAICAACHNRERQEQGDTVRVAVQRPAVVVSATTNAEAT